jgi:hypothetical protein
MWVMLYSTLLTEVKKKMRTAANFFRDPSSSGGNMPLSRAAAWGKPDRTLEAASILLSMNSLLGIEEIAARSKLHHPCLSSRFCPKTFSWGLAARVVLLTEDFSLE